MAAGKDLIGIETGKKIERLQSMLLSILVQQTKRAVKVASG